MSNFDWIMYGIIAVNGVFSFLAFSNRGLFEKYKFQVGPILHDKEYVRLLTSGFLHVSPMHLILNMWALYVFAPVIDQYLLEWQFVVIYFLSLLAGNLLALYFHKNESHYSAVGASGAVSGIVFAAVVIFPHMGLSLIFLPGLPFPGWVFGIVYLLYTVYGMSKNNDNIGHEAHMGGALIGLLLAFAFVPEEVLKNKLITIVLFAIPLLIFFIKPKGGGGKFSFKIENEGATTSRTKRSVDDLYYNEAFEREKELDRLLEKVQEQGIASLDAKEKERLEELSKEA